MIERDLYYDELVALGEEFERQVKEKNIVFPNPEIKEDCRFDFVQQYIYGDDNPQIRICW